MLNEGLKPSPGVVDALRGVISEPVETTSHKPCPTEGKLVTVRLALEGPGMFGLTNWADNKEWAGIFNHSILSARYSLLFAQSMSKTGSHVNAQRILDGMIVSHAGRRQWDEAIWYPEVAKDAAMKRSMSNETLGLHLVRGKVPQPAFELVAALAHNLQDFAVDPSVYDTMDYKLAIYVDHRTTQQYEPLYSRMGDFLLGNFFNRGAVTPDIRESVHGEIRQIITRQKDYRLGVTKGEGVGLDEADQIAQKLGASSDSSRLARKELMRLILQDADTEALLIHAGINPDNVSDQTVPMPAWEDELRFQYVAAARDSMIERMSLLTQALKNEDLYGGDLTVQGILKRIDLDFPLNTWWGQYAAKICGF